MGSGLLALAAAAAVGTFASASAPSLPPVYLTAAAGTQRATQGSACISGGGTSVCADTMFPHPQRLTVARTGERVTISVDATVSEGEVDVYPLGCSTDPYEVFRLTSATRQWTVDLPPGAYELLVFARFASTDGTASGDTSGGLGVLVDETRARAIVPLEAGIVRGSAAGGTDADRTALIRTFGGMGLTQRYQGAISGRALCLVGRAPARGPDLARARWDAYLIVGAFAARVRALGSPPIHSFQTTFLRSGKLVDQERRSLAITRARPRTVSADQILDVARGELRVRGVQKIEVTFLRPLGWAPIVTVRTQNPRGYRPERLVVRYTRGVRPLAEGALVVVRDTRGRLVREYGYAARLGRTVSWRAPRP